MLPAGLADGDPAALYEGGERVAAVFEPVAGFLNERHLRLTGGIWPVAYSGVILPAGSSGIE